jgi:hypothetical protein
LIKEQEVVALLLKKSCDYHFEVYQNPAGYSADVHGQVRKDFNFLRNLSSKLVIIQVRRAMSISLSYMRIK